MQDSEQQPTPPAFTATRHSMMTTAFFRPKASAPRKGTLMRPIEHVGLLRVPSRGRAVLVLAQPDVAAASTGNDSGSESDGDRVGFRNRPISLRGCSAQSPGQS